MLVFPKLHSKYDILLLQHTYIPVLPCTLVDMCCLPTPYLLGVLSGCLPEIADLPIDEVSFRILQPIKDGFHINANYSLSPGLLLIDYHKSPIKSPLSITPPLPSQNLK